MEYLPIDKLSADNRRGEEGLTTTPADQRVDCVAVGPSYGRRLGQFQGINFRLVETFCGKGRELAPFKHAGAPGCHIDDGLSRRRRWDRTHGKWQTVAVDLDKQLQSSSISAEPRLGTLMPRQSRCGCRSPATRSPPFDMQSVSVAL